MTKLKDSQTLRQKLKGDLATLLGTLDDLDVEDAQAFVKWTCKKANIYRKALIENTFSNLPENMCQGDIVLCDLGVNIPPEFSDIRTGKHFVIYWAQQGHNVIVIPITRKCHDSNNDFLIPIGKIDGLSDEENYIKLDSIRSVSLHRISRISGNKAGKIHSDIIVNIVKENMKKLFI